MVDTAVVAAVSTVTVGSDGFAVPATPYAGCPQSYTVVSVTVTLVLGLSVRMASYPAVAQ